MNLESHQIAAVTHWYAEGASLSDLQKRLKTEFHLSLTYLDVRLLADELKLTREEPVSEPQPVNSVLPSPEPQLTTTLPQAEGKVSVTLDTLQRPGALLSGRTTFSDGQSAEWYVDQSGSLGLNPSQPGYHPSKADVLAFQVELEKVARGQSF